MIFFIEKLRKMCFFIIINTEKCVFVKRRWFAYESECYTRTEGLHLIFGTALLLQFISLKYSCNILIPINNTVNFYILTIYFINNYIIFFSSSKSSQSSPSFTASSASWSFIKSFFSALSRS